MIDKPVDVGHYGHMERTRYRLTITIEFDSDESLDAIRADVNDLTVEMLYDAFHGSDNAVLLVQDVARVTR